MRSDQERLRDILEAIAQIERYATQGCLLSSVSLLKALLIRLSQQAVVVVRQHLSEYYRMLLNQIT